MKKRILALFMSLVMVFSFATPAYAEGTAIENSEEASEGVSLIVNEPDDGSDSFDYYEFDAVYDVGDDTEMAACADCGNEPCTCEKETPSVCETCGSESCTCEPAADPQLCAVCNSDPCICEDEASVCDTCGNEPCTCEQVTSVCPGDDTCTIEGCQNHNPPAPTQTCEHCGAELVDEAVHAEDCLTLCTCTSIDGEHQEGCALYEEPSAFEQLLEIDTLEELFDAVMANSSDVYGFDYDELMALKEHAEALYAAIDEPTADDTDYHDMLVETFVSLAVCPECGGEMGEHAEDCAVGQAEILATTWSGTQNYGTYTVSGTVTISREVTIASGKTLTLDGSGTIQRAGNYKGILFHIMDGGTLVIKGTTGKIVIDSKNVTDTNVAIMCSENLTLTNVTIKNNISGKPANANSGYSGGIEIASNTTSASKVNITDCLIQNCHASDGSGIYLRGTGCATVTVKRTIIEDCHYRAVPGVAGLGGTIRTNGNGGFNAVFEDCVVRNNTSNSFAGGGFYWNACDTTNGKNPRLTIRDCQIYGNEAGDMGGGLFLEGNNTTIEATTGTPSALLASNSYTIPSGGFIGTRIEGNDAQRGGGICFKTYANTNGILVSKTEIKFADNVFVRDNDARLGGGVALVLNTTNNYSQTNEVDFIFEIDGAVLEDNRATLNGGALYVQKDRENYDLDVNILKGTIDSNSAVNGGAIYLGGTGGDIVMTTGEITENSAQTDGGAIYITKGNFTMDDGTVNLNKALSGAGGAVYLANGNFIMSGGDIVQNSADENGGALYISGGNVTINHGILNENSATDGGAVYMDGDADTTLYFKSGQMNNNYASDDGGAIYATGGTLHIGLENCSGQTRDANNVVTDENNDEHQALDSEGICQYHPQIQGNEAEDVGGGIALAGQDASSGTTGETLSGGTVRFYCGVANTNKALYKGVGLNVFMQGGEFHYYKGTNIGEPHDPDLVIVGGKLINEDDSTDYVYLYYYNNNTEKKDEPDYIGMAKLDRFMNLPEGEYFWTADSGEVFVGWTPYGPDETVGQKSVRDKNDYKPSGTSVQINDTEVVGGPQGTYDGKTDTPDQIMHLYAVWAPETSHITYVDSLTDAESTTTPRTGTADYTLHKGAAQTITIPATNSASHPGFAIVGWYLYQDEGQNANWCNADYEAYEPAYTGNTLTPYSNLVYDKAFDEGGMMYYPLSAPNADLVLTVDPMTFGDITLVAKYELQYSDLTITKQGAQSIDENQAFLFNVIGSAAAKTDTTIKNADAMAMINALENLDMQVVIEGDGSIVIKHLPLGTYTVTENGKWSWRYGETSSNPATGQVTLGLNDSKTVTFTNTRTKSQWLSGDWYTENWWNETGIRREDAYRDPEDAETN